MNVTKINIINKKTRVKTTNRGSKKVLGYKKAIVTFFLTLVMLRIDPRQDQNQKI